MGELDRSKDIIGLDALRAKPVGFEGRFILSQLPNAGGVFNSLRATENIAVISANSGLLLNFNDSLPTTSQVEQLQCDHQALTQIKRLAEKNGALQYTSEQELIEFWGKIKYTFNCRSYDELTLGQINTIGQFLNDLIERQNLIQLAKKLDVYPNYTLEEWYEFWEIIKEFYQCKSFSDLKKSELYEISIFITIKTIRRLTIFKYFITTFLVSPNQQTEE